MFYFLYICICFNLISLVLCIWFFVCLLVWKCDVKCEFIIVLFWNKVLIIEKWDILKIVYYKLKLN